MPFKLTVKEITQAVKGQLLTEVNVNSKVIGFQSDSRKVMTDELFIPLKGDVYDAHDFIDSAIENGAKFILTHKDVPTQDGVCYIKVKDTLEALQDLAKFWRTQCYYKVLAITGSNGKTTSKEYAKYVIGDHLKVTASEGSFNNHWGVPFTILNSNTNDDVLILEMGMNHLGELKLLSEIGQQEVSVVTTVGQAHVGEVGSLENIVKAKKELYDYSPQAQHVFNLDNEHTLKMYEESSAQNKLSFSTLRETADIHLKIDSYDITGMQLSGHIAGEVGLSLIHI